jgi:hypothetical protein
LKPEKKAYVNVWFRHTILPVYPISQTLIVTAALTGIAIPSIIVRQIPVVVIMVVIGYFIGFWKATLVKEEDGLNSKRSLNLDSELKRFLIAFSPILATIVVVACLDAAVFGLSSVGLDVFRATIVGLIVLILIAKPPLHVLAKPLKSWEIYGILLATYGAFLLRNVAIATGISETFEVLVASGSVGIILLLTVVPAVLGFVTGSPSGGVAISVSILAGMLAFSPKIAALLYMSAYLGYVIAPTHLCFAFTMDYFKCSLNKVYQYIIPSFLISFTGALLIYFLV